MRKLVVACGFMLMVSVILVVATQRAGREFDALASSAATSFDEWGQLKIQKRIARMTIGEKIGQMMMVGIPGTTDLSLEMAQWLRTHHIGGVVLLGQDVSSHMQAVEFIRTLQREARDTNNPPLFIAVDQEGGTVSRFLFLTQLTAQSEIVNESHAFAVAQGRGKELRGIGVNINFSPVIDVSMGPSDFIYQRAFRGDATTVATLGSAMIRGYSDVGVISVVKHFPGHGGTISDSHKFLPVVKRGTREQNESLLPFREAIRSGVSMIMIGHLKVPTIDPVYPASISSAIITGLLRRAMNYRGVVITDDLAMGAITTTYTLSDAAVGAVRSGADIVLVMRFLGDYDEIYSALTAAIRRGEIPEERINESVTRILSLKEKFEVSE